MADGPTCTLCGLAAAGEMVQPGPAWAPVHRSCFLDWDNRCEAEEMTEAYGFHMHGHEPVREALRG